MDDRPDMVFEGLQTASGEAENTADVRFVASMKGDYRDYASVGFEFTYNEVISELSCSCVYNGIMAEGNLITPDLYEADYFFCYTIGDISEGEYVFKVRSWYVKKGLTDKIYSEQTTVTLIVSADGTASVRK